MRPERPEPRRGRQDLRGRQRGRTSTGLACAATAAVLLFTGAACGSGGDGSSGPVVVDLSEASGAAGVRGVSLGAPVAKPATTLVDTAGAPFDLRTDQATAGRVTLVFFGFTNCPDICPTTMADLDAALESLPAADRDRIRVVFVSTDPDRDTGPVIRRWLDQFDTSFIGLTGTWPHIKEFADALDVAIEPAVREADGTVNVTHSAQVTAFSPDGTARVAYLTGTSVADYAHDLPLLARGET
ncbi:SCO family protein [Parafrankia sp. FMc6]|uniref:SCO family protein n=1 Tax=Parafrankia soli TaxID=2599596 RepID=UPI0034D5E9C9